MFRVKRISLLVMAFAILLSSCAPGVQYTLPPDLTLVPGTDVPQQGATVTSDIFTQTLEPITPTPVPSVATVPPSSSGLKPADSDTPAAGICGEAQGDPVSIVLGIGPDGIPLAGRCIKITPAQRIKLINQSNGPFNILFGEYHIDLPVGSEMLLGKPAGQFLARGVHFLPMGPVLWVKEAVVVTAPPPIVEYNNSVVGYRLNLPGNWSIDENGMVNGLSKEVVFNPPNPEPFVAYLSISLDYRALDQIIAAYSQNVPDALGANVDFYGYPGIIYTYPSGRNEYFIAASGKIFMISTDRPNDGTVQSILMTIRFTAPPQPVSYDAVMADNGRTFVMNIGDKLRINLDYGYGWSTVSDFNPAMLVGAADGYFAIARGTTTLSMNGDPVCYSSTPPCLMPSILYTITVIVQ